MRPPYSVLARRMGPGKPKRRKNPNWIGLNIHTSPGRGFQSSQTRAEKLARKILGHRLSGGPLRRVPWGGEGSRKTARKTRRLS